MIYLVEEDLVEEQEDLVKEQEDLVEEQEVLDGSRMIYLVEENCSQGRIWLRSSRTA